MKRKVTLPSVILIITSIICLFMYLLWWVNAWTGYDLAPEDALSWTGIFMGFNLHITGDLITTSFMHHNIQFFTVLQCLLSILVGILFINKHKFKKVGNVMSYILFTINFVVMLVACILCFVTTISSISSIIETILPQTIMKFYVPILMGCVCGVGVRVWLLIAGVIDSTKSSANQHYSATKNIN